MKREDNLEMEELSVKVFGKKYEWKKLTKRGLVIGRDKEALYKVRRTPLSNEQAKQYMIKTLEMREQVLKDMEEKKNGEG